MIRDEVGFRIGCQQFGALLKIHSHHERVETLMQPRKQSAAHLKPRRAIGRAFFRVIQRQRNPPRDFEGYCHNSPPARLPNYRRKVYRESKLFACDLDVIWKGFQMNLARIALAALGAFVAYFVLGFLMFGLMPFLRDELRKYPAVYRNQEGQMSHMPPGMAAMFVAMLVLAVIYAMLYQGASGLAGGARLGALFGALIGVFSVCTFVIHNYVNLNIGLKLTLQQAAAYFVEWTVTGLVIGLIYRPPAPH